MIPPCLVQSSFKSLSRGCVDNFPRQVIPDVYTTIEEWSWLYTSNFILRKIRDDLKIMFSIWSRSHNQLVSNCCGVIYMEMFVNLYHVIDNPPEFQGMEGFDWQVFLCTSGSCSHVSVWLLFFGRFRCYWCAYTLLETIQLEHIPWLT